MVEVAYQTYAHCILIGPIARCFAVRPDHLPVPPKRYLDFPIRTVGSITNHEIISHADPVVFLSMGPIKKGHIPIFRGRVVDHNGVPLLLRAFGGIPIPRYAGQVPKPTSTNSLRQHRIVWCNGV